MLKLIELTNLNSTF